MRIAVVWPAPNRLTDVSIPCGQYVRGLLALGHDAFAVSTADAARGFSEPVTTCSELADLGQRDFWRELRLDAAFVVTWLQKAEVLRALRPVCPLLISIADSDGQLGVRAHPAATWERMLAQQHGLVNKLRAAKFWWQQYGYLHQQFATPFLESAACSDAILVGSTGGVASLRRFYASCRRPELGGKVRFSPYPVAECFIERPVQTERVDRVVAIGRWSDPQKDAPLLAGALWEVLELRPKTALALIGLGGEAPFDSLCARNPRARLHGHLPPSQVADILAGSRALVLSSRWEGSPVVANEALALGCTLAGPSSLPCLAGLCADGAFGTLAKHRTPRALAAAIVTELQHWDQDRRAPLAIAAAWRERLRADRVCQRVLDEVVTDKHPASEYCPVVPLETSVT